MKTVTKNMKILAVVVAVFGGALALIVFKHYGFSFFTAICGAIYAYVLIRVQEVFDGTYFVKPRIYTSNAHQGEINALHQDANWHITRQAGDAFDFYEDFDGRDELLDQANQLGELQRADAQRQIDQAVRLRAHQHAQYEARMKRLEENS